MKIPQFIKDEMEKEGKAHPEWRGAATVTVAVGHDFILVTTRDNVDILVVEFDRSGAPRWGGYATADMVINRSFSKDIPTNLCYLNKNYGSEIKVVRAVKEKWVGRGYSGGHNTASRAGGWGRSHVPFVDKEPTESGDLIAVRDETREGSFTGYSPEATIFKIQ